MDLNFTTSNPFITEYDRQQKLQRDQETQDLKNKKTGFELQQEQAEGPKRLRLMSAQATGAEANATTAQANAQVAPQEAQLRIQEARARLQTMSSAEAARMVQAKTQMFAALDQGNVDLARSIAASVGQQVPDVVIQNTNARNALKALHQQALARYPNNPRAAMQWEIGQAQAIQERQSQGQPVNPETQQYQPVQGAAPLPEEVKPPVSVPAGSTLVDPNTHQPVFQNTNMTPREEAERQHWAVLEAQKDPNYYSDPKGTIAKYLQSYGIGQQGGTTAAPAPARPQNVPQGSAYSPSRKMWRDPQGNMYDANGQPVQAAQNSAPSVPISQ